MILKLIGITGGIGSGKTTVCKIFETLGIPVYYADLMAKKIMTSNRSVKKKIKDLLGVEAYHSNGQLNRQLVSSKIFSDKTLLERINQIVHPAVKDDTDRWAEQYQQSPTTPYVLKEAALLVENGSYKTMDAIIVVTCPEDIRIKRVMKRDKAEREAVMRKVKSQLSEAEKVKVADFIIVNDGANPLIPQVWKIHQKICKLK